MNCSIRLPRANQAIALFLLGLVPNLSLAAPADTELLNRLRSELGDNDSLSASDIEPLQVLLTQETLARIEQIARTRSYPDWFHKENPVIVHEVTLAIEQALNGATTGQDVLDVAVDVLASRTAEIVMSRAAQTRSLTWYADSNAMLYDPDSATEQGQSAEPEDNAAKQALNSLSRDMLSGLAANREAEDTQSASEDKHQGDGGTTSTPLSQNGSVSSPEGPLRLNIDESTVGGDLGTIGDNNGILDPGEQATVTLVFENTTENRIYSSSLYLKTTGNCLSIMDTVPDDEHLLPEMNPGDKASFAMTVFASASDECDAEGRSLSVAIHDSLYFPEGLTFSVQLNVLPIRTGTLTNIMIDGDDFGHSEPTATTVLAPDDQVELSAGFAVNGAWSGSVQQEFYVSDLMSFSHNSDRSTIQVQAENSIANPVDDVDITVPDKNTLYDRLADMTAFYRWAQPSDAAIFVSVDSQLSIEEIPYTEEGSNVEMVSEATTSPQESTPPVPSLDKAQLEQILSDHVTVLPVTRAPDDDGAIIMVDGFAIAVDNPTELLQDIADQSQSGAAVAASAIATQPTSNTATYTVRHYIELPVEWKPDAVCDVAVTNQTIGEEMTVTGQLEHIPEGAQVRLTMADSEQEHIIDLASVHDNAFSLNLKTSAIGTWQANLVVEQDDQVLCTTTAEYRVHPFANYPLRFSLEPGTINTPVFSSRPVLGMSFGNKLRVYGRVSGISDSDNLHALGGLRYTWAFTPTYNLVVEPSAQLAGGVARYQKNNGNGDVLLTSLVEGSLNLAVHTSIFPTVNVGPYLNVATGMASRTDDRYTAYTMGLGVYFPR